MKTLLVSTFIFSLLLSSNVYSQDMRLPGASSSGSESSKSIDFSKETKLKQDLKDMSLSVANQLMKCCSTWGGTNVWGEVDYENVRFNELSKTFIVPMTIGWQGSFSGNQYYIKGQLVIDGNGNRSWNKIKDSGGFSPGCGNGCIN